MVKQRLEKEGDKGKPVVDSIDALLKKLEPVEQNLMQVNMKSSEGNLGFPNMLNEQYDSFRQTIEAADGSPTQQDYLVFDNLHGRLQAQLTGWKQIASAQVPSVNELVRKENVPLVEVPAGKD